MTSVSVVIPAYNVAHFLAEAIESALFQVPEPREVIVVDDGSTDGTAEVAESFGAAVRVIRQANQGIGAARNAAIAVATGELLAFLDGDDVWPMERLALLTAALSTGKQLDGVFGSVVEFFDGAPDGEPVAARLASSMLIQRESFLRVGPFREDLKLGEFVDWYTRAEDMGLRFAQIPEVVLRRRLHQTNTGRLQRDSRIDYVRVARAALERRRSGMPRD